MPLIDDDINKILFLVQKGELQLDLCKFAEAERFQVTKHTVKDSSSQSEVLFANLRLKEALAQNLSVAMKIWINGEDVPPSDQYILAAKDYDYAQTLSMNYEAVIYSVVTSSFMDTGKSNNFIPFVQLMQCSVREVKTSITNAMKKMDYFDFKQVFNKLLTDLQQYNAIQDTLKLTILVTGSLKNADNLLKMEKFLVDYQPNKSECQQIIIQVLYALLLMQEIKLIHNDLHLGNIFIERLSSPVKITCGEISFYTTLIPRIYDWDLSYCPIVGDNPKFSGLWADYLNLGNRFRKNSDYYQFFCGLMSHGIDLTSFVPPNKKFDWGYAKAPSRFRLTAVENVILFEYIKKHNIEKSSNGFYYINMPKYEFMTMFSTFDPAAVFRIRDLVIKFELTDVVHFGTNMSREIIFETGHRCYPIYDPSDRLLYPLEYIFQHNSPVINNFTSDLMMA